MDARTAQSGRSSNPIPAHRAIKEARQTESMYFMLDFWLGNDSGQLSSTGQLKQSTVTMCSWEVGGKSKCGGGK